MGIKGDLGVETMTHIGPRGFYKRDCTNDVKIWGTLRLHTENPTFNPKA